MLFGTQKRQGRKALADCFRKGFTLQKKEPVKTLFNLSSGREIGAGHTLLLEAGKEHCCHAYWHKPTNTIDALVFSSFDETEAEQCLSDVLSKVQNQNIQTAVVCSAFAEALLIPNKFFVQDYSMLDAVYGLPLQTRLHDAIQEWQLINMYMVPAFFKEAVQRAFPSAAFYHAYTPSIKIYNGYVADNQIAVHFTTRQFRILFKKDSGIQLAQTVSYKTPLDVVYYLLKICYEFVLTQSDVHLILSGLIEKESALFNELQQYFSNVHFAHPPDIALPGSEHPHHFFTSLYNLAVCAS